MQKTTAITDSYSTLFLSPLTTCVFLSVLSWGLQQGCMYLIRKSHVYSFMQEHNIYTVLQYHDETSLFFFLLLFFFSFLIKDCKRGRKEKALKGGFLDLLYLGVMDFTFIFIFLQLRAITKVSYVTHHTLNLSSCANAISTKTLE